MPSISWRHPPRTNHKSAGFGPSSIRVATLSLQALQASAVVLLRQGIPSYLFVSHSVVPLLAFKLLDDIFGLTGCSKKQNAPDILVSLFPRLIFTEVERRGMIGA